MRGQPNALRRVNPSIECRDLFRNLDAIESI